MSAEEIAAQRWVIEPGTWQDVLANVPGLSYRQLDYWTRLGVVVCIDGRNEPGSGQVRRWDPETYPVIRRMVALRAAGVNMATAQALSWGVTHELAPGVRVTFAEGT